MPAFETNLLVLLFVLLILAAFAGLGGALWKPIGRRAWRYLRLWWQQDKVAEAEARRCAVARKAARQELAEACGDEVPNEETAAEAAKKLRAEGAPSPLGFARSLKKDKYAAKETPKISLINRK